LDVPLVCQTRITQIEKVCHKMLALGWAGSTTACYLEKGPLPGTNVMILKPFSPKHLEKILTNFSIETLVVLCKTWIT
jgi:hypothetical protein